MIGDWCSADWLGRRLSHRSSADEAAMSSTEIGNTATCHDEFIGVLVLDCRSPEEYSACHVIGSLCVTVPTIVLRRLMRCGGSFPMSAANAIGVISDGDASTAGGIGGSTCASGLLGLVERCRRADLVILYDDGEGIDKCDGGSETGDVLASGQRTSSTSVVNLLLSRLSTDRCRVSRLEGKISLKQFRFRHESHDSHHVVECI